MHPTFKKELDFLIACYREDAIADLIQALKDATAALELEQMQATEIASAATYGRQLTTPRPEEKAP